MSSAPQAGTVSKKAPYKVVIPVSESRTKTDGVAYHVKMKIERDGKAAGFLHNFKYAQMHVLNNNLWHGHTVVESITIDYETPQRPRLRNLPPPSDDADIATSRSIPESIKEEDDGTDTSFMVAGGQNGFGSVEPLEEDDKSDASGKLPADFQISQKLPRQPAFPPPPHLALPPPPPLRAPPKNRARPCGS